MSSKARQFADQVSNLISISSGGSDFITPEILSASIAGIQEDIDNIDLTSTIITASSAAVSELNNRIIISSASPTVGNNNGRLWIDTTSASAPAISIYGENNWRDPRPRVKALGGIKTFFGQYTIHTFLGSGTFTALEDLNVEYLVVAGGGAGGMFGGGGGAGGYRSSVVGESSGGGSFAEPTITLLQDSYPITVGAGAPQTPNNNAQVSGANGNNSIAFNITSIGGGGGSSSNTLQSGIVGGSGGGIGPRNSLLGGSGTSNQGFKGGNASPTTGSDGGAGGGGGAGGVGLNGKSPEGRGGNGGDGLVSTITGYPVIRAGGGGGIGDSRSGTSPEYGKGGLGGGGNSVIVEVLQNTVTSGEINTGSGGGSGSTSSPATVGGGGGSGIVIIRYLT